jgi:hypothetical protein
MLDFCKPLKLSYQGRINRPSRVELYRFRLRHKSPMHRNIHSLRRKSIEIFTVTKNMYLSRCNCFGCKDLRS